MMDLPGSVFAKCLKAVLLWVCFSAAIPATAQEAAESPKAMYEKIRSFALTDSAFKVENLLLKKDRVEITLTGLIAFSGPVGGRVTGAVFRGQGMFRAPVPTSRFERESVRRLIKADTVESDFNSAVFVFSDATFQEASAGRGGDTAVPQDVSALATNFLSGVLKETGANLAARVLASMLNEESPGFFSAQFDGGKRGRFGYVLDYQNRVPVSSFDLNGGEAGLVYSYRNEVYHNDIWMAFPAGGDAGRAESYSDQNDQVDIQHYAMDLDLREANKALKLLARIDMVVRAPKMRALSMVVGESLSSYQNERMKYQLHLKSAKVDGAPVECIQEDWEGGFTLVLPAAMPAGQKLTVEVSLEGDFMQDVDRLPRFLYPQSNSDWYPRSGYLDRATYDLTFHHRKEVSIAATGVRLREEADPASKADRITQYKMEQPVAMAVFAVGPFERQERRIKWEKGGETPMAFHSLPGALAQVNEEFMLAELDNAIRYFTALFGTYPYSSYSAAIHPYGFGQGFATMLMLPSASYENKHTFSFIAHETAHQWWGNIVAWRSYRDQWLSEGFAEYSGILYAGRRDSAKAQKELLDECRDSLLEPPVTTTGIGAGRLNDVGPIALGHRLETSQTMGSYSALVYNKGALVLRMLHMLFIDPASGSGQPFFDMMTDFVNRFRGKAASTEDFRKVAGEHFSRTAAAKKSGQTNLDWFFNQWVYQTALPSYRFEYAIEDQPDGSAIIRGTLFQENAGEDWLMLLPLVVSLGENQVARTNIGVLGLQSPVTLKLPRRPNKVELDPDKWVLSEKTTTRGR